MFRKRKFEEAIELLRFSNDETKQSDSHYYASAEAIDVGAVVFSLNQYDSALYCYNIAQTHADEFSNQLRNVEDDSEKQNDYVDYQYMVNINDEEIVQRYYRMMWNLNACYTTLFKTTGNYAKALEHSELKSAFNDSLTYLTQNVEERKMQIRLETEKMEHQLDLLATDNALKQSILRNNSLIFLSVILVLLTQISH